MANLVISTIPDVERLCISWFVSRSRRASFIYDVYRMLFLPIVGIERHSSWFEIVNGLGPLFPCIEHCSPANAILVVERTW